MQGTTPAKDPEPLRPPGPCPPQHRSQGLWLPEPGELSASTAFFGRRGNRDPGKRLTPTSSARGDGRTRLKTPCLSSNRRGVYPALPTKASGSLGLQETGPGAGARLQKGTKAPAAGGTVGTAQAAPSLSEEPTARGPPVSSGPVSPARPQPGGFSALRAPAEEGSSGAQPAAWPALRDPPTPRASGKVGAASAAPQPCGAESARGFPSAAGPGATQVGLGRALPSLGRATGAAPPFRPPPSHPAPPHPAPVPRWPAAGPRAGPALALRVRPPPAAPPRAGRRDPRGAQRPAARWRRGGARPVIVTVDPRVLLAPHTATLGAGTPPGAPAPEPGPYRTTPPIPAPPPPRGPAPSTPPALIGSPPGTPPPAWGPALVPVAPSAARLRPPPLREFGPPLHPSRSRPPPLPAPTSPPTLTAPPSAGFPPVFTSPRPLAAAPPVPARVHVAPSAARLLPARCPSVLPLS
ncbi:basic proline-rich protein-like [Lontra canadensis]|uniref:basic proline-rich protein-like n=1 Tax=Lontra canadensis TaxID=76717 RepID=UPI0013F2CD54|nr:basic proline-rich protein-like [Lontra canadensis]